METRILSCAAPIGKGGLGQHLAQLVEETRGAGLSCRVFCGGASASGSEVVVVSPGRLQRVVRPILYRMSGPALNTFDANHFDRRVADQLDGGIDRFMGFVGTSLHSFRKASASGAHTLELIAANSHVKNVARQHERASQQLGIRDTWLGSGQIQKTLLEYETADLIYVHSDYTRDSMIREGIAEDKLVRTHLKVAPRFCPDIRTDSKEQNDVFRIVYAGRLDATKGIPLLIRAFKALSVEKSELRLVGGFASRTIREHCLRLVGDDSRVTIQAGDPLRPFQDADVYVHPTFEDGFAYAPAEALACGTPVIVTEDTGMKEYVRHGENGYIVPTGDLDAVTDCLNAIRRQPLKSASSLLPPDELRTPAVDFRP